MTHHGTTWGRLLAIVVLLIASTSRASAQQVKEFWYVLEMMGQRAGWMMTRESKIDDRITTESKSLISVAQGANAIKVEVTSAFIETSDGKAISMESTRKFGAMDVRQEYRFVDDGVLVTTTQSGRVSESKVAGPEGEWLTPHGATEYFMKRLEAGADTIVLRSIDAQSGLAPVNTKYFNFTESKLEHHGATIDVKWFDVEISSTPGVKSRQCVDLSGNLIRNETLMGGMKVITRLSTRDEALGELAAPEIMMKSFVRPDKAIVSPRMADRAVYLVSAPDELPDFPITGSQSFERIDAKSALVTVSIESRAVEASHSPDESAANAMIDCKDPEIIGAMKRALEGMEDASVAARAEALRRFAFRFIEKRLGVGFATASEVARTRTGDCSEHGVYLAALLRANGIPARVAAGMIYADSFAGSSDIFGYHMWTQAWIEENGAGRWVDLDATLPNVVPYDATHITLAVMSLKDDDLTTSMASMATTLGTLRIEIKDIGGTTTRDHR
ncbi:MAG: transglutaminase-like domain-containing protein [Phycisphaerales bacterium]